MTDSKKINAMLQASPFPRRYIAQAGQYLKIDLPKLPLTRYTEFVRLHKETFGDTNCFVELDSPDEGEGSLLPRQIRGRAICPGKFHILLRAVDSLSGQQIPNVSPIDIVVEVEK
ncbi:MAG TPA: hypothetical protein VHQ94_19295 [Pyrinomonadaceae bacterium]|jgi:hypothetical protein|nr:hypothetical protein [Pyrinomonadaceae bacterium]